MLGHHSGGARMPRPQKDPLRRLTTAERRELTRLRRSRAAPAAEVARAALKALPQRCDRMAMMPDGKLLYVPSFERDIWNVVDGASGAVVATIETRSGAHNTVASL